METNVITTGDCLDALKLIPDNSVDAIITDAPYELGFMGKHWDNTGIANNVLLWKDCLRVLKPGAYLLSFGGTRTYHRMACAIEDAGFEVRDMIEWVYGSGFPKSLNIGKAVDKLQGNEREVIGSRKAHDIRGNALMEATVPEYKKEISQISINISEGTSEWEGWGTALKPAHEPICMARKPLSEKSVAENCLKWGTGGINIDGSRVESEPELAKNWDRKAPAGFGNGLMKGGLQTSGFKENTPTGRFPANLIHDGSDEVKECFPETKNISQGVRGRGSDIYAGGKGFANTLAEVGQDVGYGDSGSASRFFKSIIYTAKASKSERNEGCEDLELRRGGSMEVNTTDVMQLGGASLKGEHKEIKLTKNHHPTVKPVALMEYLIKMVTKDNAVVLDPFMGSGTTAVACLRTNRKFIGIEKEADYVKIAEARIKPYLKQEKLDLSLNRDYTE